jgi:hypothetical protein
MPTKAILTWALAAAMAHGCLNAEDAKLTARVTQEAGELSLDKGSVGFAWRNAKLDVADDRVSGSLELKVWNDKAAPITQILVTQGRRVRACLFNDQPGSSDRVDFTAVQFSFQVDPKSGDGLGQINIAFARTDGVQEATELVESGGAGTGRNLGQVTPAPACGT